MTGLPEDVILWELPLNRGMAYMHASMTREGVDMRWGDEEPDDVTAKAMELARSKPWRR